MAVAEDIGRNIQSRRRELNLSQRALARRVRVSVSAVYRWESGRSMPRRDHLEALTRELGISLADLIREQP